MPLHVCPDCELPMKTQAYEDVLIDVCPSCRGVWLDRGELQKIIAHVREQERDEAEEIARPQPPPSAARPAEPPLKGKSERKKKLGGLWDFLEDILD